MGVADLLAFELLDPPPRGALLRALLDLHAIAALDDAGGLTALGRRISRLPVEPRLGAALAAAERLGCVDEVATIAAMLSGEEPFARDGARAAGAAAGAADGRESVALARARLGARDVSARVDVYSSDHLFLLALDCAFAAALAAGAPAAQRWAADWGVLPRAMHAAREVRAQLIGLVARGRAAGAPSGTSDGHAEPLGARVRRAICARGWRGGLGAAAPVAAERVRPRRRPLALRLPLAERGERRRAHAQRVPGGARLARAAAPPLAAASRSARARGRAARAGRDSASGQARAGGRTRRWGWGRWRMRCGRRGRGSQRRRQGAGRCRSRALSQAERR
jgi:hypothetical protein